MSVIQISLGFVNVFLVKGKQNILVDAGLTGTLDKILAGLRANGLSPGDISYIIVTHGHVDHVGELMALKELTGAKVIMHKADAEFLFRGETPGVIPTNLKSKILKMVFVRDIRVNAVRPDIIIEDDIELNELGAEGKIICTPGHTKGCISLILPSGQAIVGDMLDSKKNGSAGYPIFAYDLQLVKNSLTKVVSYSLDTIYSSHGAPCSTEAVKRLII